MAATVVNLVLSKLTDAVVQEALFLYGVSDKVKWVERELTWIQSFLKDADTKCHKDERVKCWVNEVKEVGLSIEDALDKMLVEIGGSNQKGFRKTLKQIGKLPMKMIAKHNLNIEIDEIQQRIRQISENITNYGISGLNDSNTAVASSNLPVRPFVIPDIDETEIVGFEVDKKTIIDQLTDADIARRSVISIVGAGGSGKTTLAKEVFKSAEVERHFAIRIWLTISQEYKLIDILIKMLGEIKKVDSEMRQKGEEYFITELYKSLKEGNYLVILDDVWSTDLWTQLEAALPSTINNSRVLITSRFIKIAEEADAISKPYEIRNLNEKESQQLLLKKVFPNRYTDKCSDNLLPLTTQFAKKCDGWPLALVVLGGILSRTIPNYCAWDEVMRNMDWHIDGSKCMGVISTSYEHLPIHLKACFMYFAVFPEDYEIKATSLIRMWVAEGFIFPDASKQMEDIAESYLEELAQRCMVKVSSRSVRGKIKYCHLHDLLRELAIHKANEQNFLTAFCKNDGRLSGSNSSARRVAFNYCGDINMPLACASPNLRTLHYFGDNIPNPSRFGMLRLLNVVSNYTEDKKGSCPTYEKKWKTLTALRYFGFEKNKGAIATRHVNNMLSSLYHTKNLQTVDILFIPETTVELPMSFWENKRLRHVIIRCSPLLQSSFDGPPLSADLPNLLTLKGVNARQEWGAKLPHFPHLRKLKLFASENVNVDQIVNTLISNQQDLDYLHLNFGEKAMPLLSGASAMTSHKRLSSLHLFAGTWPRPKQEAIDYVSMLLPHLVELTILRFRFEEDPMPRLEKLSNLKALELAGGCTDQRMICSSGGFGSLQQLRLYLCNLEEWKIEEGAMVSLNRLKLECGDLKVCPNLQFLSSLQRLNLLCRDHFKSRLQGDDHWKIKHISSVKFDGRIC